MGKSPIPSPHEKSHRDVDHQSSNHIEHNGKSHSAQMTQMMGRDSRDSRDSRDEIITSNHSSAKHLPASPIHSPQHMNASLSMHHLSNGNGNHSNKNGVHTNGVAVLPTTPTSMIMHSSGGGGGGLHIDTDDQDDQQQFSSLSAMQPQSIQNTKFSLLHFAMQHFRDE